MTVKLIKNHLDHKAGDVIDVSEERAEYWHLCGVAEKVNNAGATKKRIIQPKKEKSERLK